MLRSSLLLVLVERQLQPFTLVLQPRPAPGGNLVLLLRFIILKHNVERVQRTGHHLLGSPNNLVLTPSVRFALLQSSLDEVVMLCFQILHRIDSTNPDWFWCSVHGYAIFDIRDDERALSAA